MYRPLEPDDYVSIFILKGAGLSYTTIGMLFGCCAKTVSRHLKANFEWAKNEAERQVPYGIRAAHDGRLPFYQPDPEY